MALINRIFTKERWNRDMLTTAFSQKQKIAYLDEIKKFIDLHKDADLFDSLDPGIHALLLVAKNRDVQKLARLHYEKGTYNLK